MTQFREMLTRSVREFYRDDLSHRTRLGLRARAQHMATICKKDHSHFSRCEISRSR